MAKHSISLLVAMVLALLVFVITMVFSALAGPGICKSEAGLCRNHRKGFSAELGEHLTSDLCPSDPFLESTGNISDEFTTQITPSGWTFSIWSIIYIFQALVLLYTLSGLFRKYEIFPRVHRVAQINGNVLVCQCTSHALCPRCLQERLRLRLLQPCRFAAWLLCDLVFEFGPQHWMAVPVGQEVRWDHLKTNAGT